MESSIPIDLVIEIVSRLPAKSVARCRCVSKLWRSVLLRQDFTDLFLTRSKSRPRLLLEVQQLQDGHWSFLSSPQLQKPSPVVATADFHIKFSKGISRYSCSYAFGLIYFHNMNIPKDDEDVKRVICNPLTGQYLILPELRVSGGSYSYLGFDPVDKEFKVLFMNTFNYIADNDTDHYILTLGTGELRWRKIQCPFTHEPFWERICIGGVLYYSAQVGREKVIVCFDVRSETFKFIGVQRFHDHLVNYKGKLGVINTNGRFSVDLSMYVLEDVEKQEWSKYAWSRDVKFNDNRLSVVGVTASGEIVLSTHFASTPFYVLYFNPERNTLQIVEFQGVGGANCDCEVYAFVDYVEDLSIDDAVQLNSSPFELGRNFVPEMPKPQRYTSLDLSNSSQSVLNKEQNKYGLSANLLYRSVGVAISSVVLFSLFTGFFKFYHSAG